MLHADIRQKQLECVLQILQSQGDSLGPGWPLVLGVIGAICNDQGLEFRRREHGQSRKYFTYLVVSKLVVSFKYIIFVAQLHFN